jgi:hypothetical protein
MYGFHGATMSAYRAISSRPAFVAKKPYVREVRRGSPETVQSYGRVEVLS